MSFDDWISRRRAPRRPWTVLGREVRGVVSWNLNDACNYRCAYCTQRRMRDRRGQLEAPGAALAALAELPGCWEIKLSGGEPFQQPGLVDLAAGLAARGHLISIQTNFSAPNPELRAFLEATRGALHVFSASLHLDYATPEQIAQRYEVVRPYEAHGLRFHVTSVALPERLDELRRRVKPLLDQHGILFKVQPQKIDGYVRDYDEQQRQILLELGGHNLTGNVEHDFQGKLCHAGASYLVIKSTGDAYRCYPASRLGGRFARLGSLRAGIRLLEGAALCPYTYCNCTVPIQRGMIEGLPAPSAHPPGAAATGG